MDQNAMHTALNVLIRVKENLLENMVDELIRHQDDDPSSFSIQEIEDRYAIRIANLNTLIATMQDQLGQHNQVATRMVSSAQEVSYEKLESKLNEVLEFIAPEELSHLSVVPVSPGKYLIVMAHQEYCH